MKHTCILIQGATGSGKTTLAHILAQELRGELINADSRQVYKGADIGTNKEIFSDIPTHLIDIRAITDPQYDAYTFKHDAQEVIHDIIKRGKIPIIVGGSAFYINVLLDKITIDEHHEDFKEFLLDQEPVYNEKPLAELHYLLQVYDKNLYDSLNNSEKHNKQRIIKKILSYEFYQKNPRPKKLREDSIYTRYDIRQFAIAIDKDTLQEKIQIRTQQLIHKGLRNEVLRLLTAYGSNNPIFTTIGYKEYLDFVDAVYGDFKYVSHITALSIQDETNIAVKIYMNTMHYVKQQMTWLKRDADIVWIPSANIKEMTLAIRSSLKL